MVYTRDHNDKVFGSSSENRETICNGIKITEFALTLEPLVSYKIIGRDFKIPTCESIGKRMTVLTMLRKGRSFTVCLSPRVLNLGVLILDFFALFF